MRFSIRIKVHTRFRPRREVTTIKLDNVRDDLRFGGFLFLYKEKLWDSFTAVINRFPGLTLPKRDKKEELNFSLHLHGVSKTGTDLYFTKQNVLQPIAKRFSDNSTLILEKIKDPGHELVYMDNVLPYNPEQIAQQTELLDICAICCAPLSAPYYDFKKSYDCNTHVCTVEGHVWLCRLVVPVPRDEG